MTSNKCIGPSSVIAEKPHIYQIYALGGKAALDDLERVEIWVLKVLLRVQVHTKTLHVLAKLGSYPLHVTWQLQAAY